MSAQNNVVTSGSLNQTKNDLSWLILGVTMYTKRKNTYNENTTNAAWSLVPQFLWFFRCAWCPKNWPETYKQENNGQRIIPYTFDNKNWSMYIVFNNLISILFTSDIKCLNKLYQ